MMSHFRSTDGTPYFLVNRRMNKSHQMRWLRRGVIFCSRFAALSTNGTFGSKFGQKLHPANDIHAPAAIASCPQTCDCPVSLKVRL
jgi:hypothetical protein